MKGVILIISIIVIGSFVSILIWPPEVKEKVIKPPCNYIITIESGDISAGWCTESYEVVDGMLYCIINDHNRIIPLTSIREITIND